MENQELIQKLLTDLKTYPNMRIDLCLQKHEALRTLYKRENDQSHALGINLELRKRLNIALNSKSSTPREQKQLLKNIGRPIYLQHLTVFIRIFCTWKKIETQKRGFTNPD